MSYAERSPIPYDDASADWYVSAMEHLVEVAQNLSHARDLQSVMDIVRVSARKLTGADGASFVLRDNDKCYYAEEDAISPLWKGQRFPLEICISGWVMNNAQPVVLPDIYQDPRIPAHAYKPTFVRSMVMVPIRTTKPIGAIGCYWAKNRTSTPEEVKILQGLANVTSIAMENADLYSQLQQKIIALEASNYELSRFAWIASHDLKSPLRAIDHLSQWIEDDSGGRLADESKVHLRSLRQRVHRMEKLLDDILAYARVDHKLDTRETEMIDGRGLLEDIKALTDIPPSFVLNAHEGFMGVRGPRVPLQQILCNLVNNAVRHHDRAGGHIDLNAQDEGDRLVFFVKDDGPGIPKDYHEKIFNMFETIKPHETKQTGGMGLALVKKLLTVYGGDIIVESGKGRGSTFRITWPKYAKKAA